jgi:hypothetical protein
MAKDRLGLDGDVIEGGHMVALGNPGEVADRLETFRRETVSPNG